MKLFKKNLRDQLREKRSLLPESLQQHFSLLIAQKIVQHPFFKLARSIALYSPAFGEVRTMPIFQYAQIYHKMCYLPVLQENYLAFVNVDNTTALHPNRFKILEPLFDEKKVILPTHLDLVIVPLIAFDLKRHRLGMGGGFYDRTFAFKQHQIKKPKLVGIAYDFQCVQSVPRTSLDVLLDAVVTEKKVYIT